MPVHNPPDPLTAANPASKAYAVTPNDGADISFVSRAIWVGSAGNLRVMMADQYPSEPVTFVAVAAGTLLPIRVRRVYSTGTTAGNILCLT